MHSKALTVLSCILAPNTPLQGYQADRLLRELGKKPEVDVSRHVLQPGVCVYASGCPVTTSAGGCLHMHVHMDVFISHTFYMQAAAEKQRGHAYHDLPQLEKPCTT